MPVYTAYDPRMAQDAREQAEQQKEEARIAAVMHEMEQNGERIATWANKLAMTLLAVFSMASLLSISLEAFNAFITHLGHGWLDIPNLLNVLLNLLLVLAMDMGMFYAASVIRAVFSAGGAWREIWIHVVIMVAACAMETATYIFLVVQYDRPTSGWLWAIGISRGIAAPIFATYLSLARKIPVAPRDIAYYVSLLSGRGVVHDVAVLAADRHAPLHRKVNIYTASATMAAHEFAKFSRIIAAVEEPAPAASQTIEAKRQEEPKPERQERPELPEPQPERTQGPIPLTTPVPSRQPQRETERETERELAPAAVMSPVIVDVNELTGAQRRPRGARNRRGLGSTGFRSAQDERAEPDMVETPDRMALRIRREEAARRILAENPAINSADLARKIAVATKARISESTARNIRDAVRFADARTVDEAEEEDASAIEQRRN